MMINKSYDVIIVGAGPSGSTAAMFAARKGVSVLVLEKDREIGLPVRCAEAVSKEGIAEFIEPNMDFVSSTITKFSLTSPSGIEVIIPLEQIGYVLDRTRFDKAIAQEASKNGAQFVTRAYVNNLLIENGIVNGVVAEINGVQYKINSKIVIAADGVESRIGRRAGLKTFIDFREMEGAFQVLATNISIPNDSLQFFFGKNVAPEGYLWIFPKNNNSANIGIGISGAVGKKKSASKYLNEFLEKKFPEVSILSQVAGGVPCSTTLDKIVAPGILLVGDAARQVNPLSGGGIVSGMIGGSIGGEVAANCILNNNLSGIFEYQTLWMNRLGKRHTIFDKVKSGVYKFSDEQFNSLAESFNKISYQNRSLGKLFKQALFDNPKLLIEAAKIFIMN